MSVSLDSALCGWSSDDLGNLCSILEVSQSDDIEAIKDRFKWLYHSKTNAHVESAARKTAGKVLSMISKVQQREVTRDDLRAVPDYSDLVIDACKQLNACEDGASLSEHETFLSEAIIVAALQRMKPRERMKFFEQQVNAHELMPAAGVNGPTLAGPATTAAMLGAAQMSGFGVYVASTTALGFVTHAVGVTLPFAVYTGLTSTIAFVIGPAGWLTAGIWGWWKLTGPEWKKLIPALIYIIAVNSRGGGPPDTAAAKKPPDAPPGVGPARAEREL
ncbi:MAG TPA: hypothetical protein VMV10_17315 [Pirellulales bacterium]|nr:hypothetical protein [Pirellulales bacterium]